MRQNQIPAFQKALLAWYQKNARDLPWRRTKDPYAIWVSEIMLQQTQVKTVIPYYEKWLRQFPTVKRLAESPSETVMNHWAGLGYYRRARMLHQAAQFLSDKKEAVPSELNALMKIPGIGRYTAGAIASIAFEKKVPVLDGNVIRILTRLYAIKEDIGSPKTIKKLWGLAEIILPDKKIGDFNQALMELGATVCFPQSPSCLICPVNSFCDGAKLGPEKFPVKNKKEKAELLETAALILRNKNRLLLEKQPSGGRWGGLWMFPHWRSSKSMLKETGFKEKDLSRRMTVKHGFTKYRITLQVYESSLKSNRKAFGDERHQWIAVSSIKNLPFPAPHQKIVSEILKND